MTNERRRGRGDRYPVPAHGVYSSSAVAPRIAHLKRSLLARMGLRQRDLSWAARELLDTYCRAKAKVQTIDEWLEREPMIRHDGSYPDVLKLYFVALNASTRALEALRAIVSELRSEDRDIASALAVLDTEAGKRKR
jgi:hypothetical protein